MKFTPIGTLLVCIAICLASCSKSNKRESASIAPVAAPPKHGDSAKLSREVLSSGIYEAVFRYQFDHGDPNIPRTSRGSRYKPYYLGIVHDDFDIAGYGIPSDESIEDPNNTFIERFHGISPIAKSFSQCKKSISGVTDNSTGLPGVLLLVGKVRWVSKTEVEVDAGYYFQSHCAAGQVFHLVWADDEFRVATVDQPWTS